MEHQKNKQIKQSVIYTSFLLLSLFIFDVRATAKEYLITDYGAVADGKTMNTEAIQSAINEASENGGGSVVFPNGDFLSGCLELKSNVELFLRDGAVLLGSTNPDDYYEMKTEGRPESPKKNDNSQMALIVAFRANNIALKGRGLIDGQGRALALTIDSLHHAGVRIDPKYNYGRMRPNETARPKLFRFSECDHVEVSDLQLKNSACWGLSFELCSNMVFVNLKINNRAYWNNDGIDITDCRNVKVINCDVNSADDGICLKSYYPGYFNDSIYIANCTVRSSASAIKFGTASFGGFKNVTVENIKVFDTFRSAIAIESVDGGDIENINVSNISAKNTGNAIFIRIGHREGEQPGMVRNIHIKDVKVQVPFGRPDIDYDMRGPAVNYRHNPHPSSVVGIPGYDVEGVILENIEITYPGRATKGMAYIPLSDLDRVPEKIKNYPEFSMFGELPAWGFFIRHAKGIVLKNVRLKLNHPDFRPAFVFDDVAHVNMTKIDLPEGNMNQVVFRDVKGADLEKSIVVRRISEE
ncbi:glycoside hydrolase family 28 protein [Gaoshiqia sediminis]|uniref:Glycosyl hydrolase family 28 protein n=1 Tax=Gaoshiqia sediminis TaxID=2986998 RepID=A0AA41YBD7_9BACT|nr:glycosyl hydrolase family 28 protein [Gaoshiqia sediminis]MCW0484972.1 glycosyl hydrolase family 28 protein [Gaoshiqia sediminis]